jgi:hypothetical protein
MIRMMILAAAAMLWEGPVDAATSRAGAISKFDGVDEIVEACTTSTTFVNMPGMSKTFTQGGSGSDEVVALFEAAASLSGDTFDTGFVRLQVGTTVQTPGEVPLIGANQRGTHGFNWQTAPVAAGSRTIRVQWRTDLGSQFCVDARSLIIEHK